MAGLLLAVFSLVALPLPLPVLTACLMLLIATFTYVWRHHHALNGHNIKVRLDSEGNWHWQQGESNEPVELLGDSYHATFLVILNFKLAEKPSQVKTLLLTTDNINLDIFRRLRAHLKWQEGIRTQSKLQTEGTQHNLKSDH